MSVKGSSGWQSHGAFWVVLAFGKGLCEVSAGVHKSRWTNSTNINILRNVQRRSLLQKEKIGEGRDRHHGRPISGPEIWTWEAVGDQTQGS